jgi:hypothetical protein
MPEVIELLKPMIQTLGPKDLNELFDFLAELLNKKKAPTPRKQSPKNKVPTFAQAQRIFSKNPEKVFVEEVAGYFGVSISTIRNNSKIFKLCEAILPDPNETTKSRANPKTGKEEVIQNPRRFGRKTPYSTIKVMRLKKFMAIKKINSFNGLKNKIATDPTFAKEVENLKDFRLCKINV